MYRRFLQVIFFTNIVLCCLHYIAFKLHAYFYNQKMPLLLYRDINSVRHLLKTCVQRKSETKRVATKEKNNAFGTATIIMC